MSFFGFDATLPERRGGLDDGLLGGAFDNQAGAEDIAVYTWGTEDYDGLGDQLQEAGDDTNDMTFGGGGNIGQSSSTWQFRIDLTFEVVVLGTDFKFAQQTAQHAGNGNRGYQQTQATSYGSKSKLKPTKPASDLFASTEADFFGASKKCRFSTPRRARSIRG
jgi:hypothetical protein